MLSRPLKLHHPTQGTLTKLSYVHISKLNVFQIIPSCLMAMFVTHSDWQTILAHQGNASAGPDDSLEPAKVAVHRSW